MSNIAQYCFPIERTLGAVLPRVGLKEPEPRRILTAPAPVGVVFFGNNNLTEIYLDFGTCCFDS
jgi:hypothetical protein